MTKHLDENVNNMSAAAIVTLSEKFMKHWQTDPQEKGIAIEPFPLTRFKRPPARNDRMPL
jgi:hypothetical protein